MWWVYFWCLFTVEIKYAEVPVTVAQHLYLQLFVTYVFIECIVKEVKEK